MSYADQPVMSPRKIIAIALVVLLHVLIGYAFITGLAYDVIKKAATDLNVIDIKEPPPPPEKPLPPPPKPKTEAPPPPVYTPPQIVQTPSPAPPMQTVNVQPPPQPPTPIAAPPAPTITPPAPPAAPSQASGAKPKGNPGGWVTNDDYPSASMRNEEQGTTGFRLDIGPDGRVTNCSVTSSSGSSALDDTACRLLVRRARFTPAKDAAGNGLPASYSSRIRWEIPKN